MMKNYKFILFSLTLLVFNLSGQNAFASKQSATDVKQMRETFKDFLECADRGNDYVEIRKCRKPLVDSKMNDAVIDRYLAVDSKYIKATSLVECPTKTEALQKKHFPDVTHMLCFPSQFSAKGDSSVLFKKEKTLRITEILF